MPRRSLVGLFALVAALPLAAFASSASARPAPSQEPQRVACSALGFSDALDKRHADGHEVGGLSAVAYDARRHAYAAIEDHSDGQATRMWFLRKLPGAHAKPRVVGTLTLRAPDGSAYDDTDFDAEGLTVLPNGHYLVSSEVEPSIREFDRRGHEVGQLRVPPRFRVAPTGGATENATLEGLTISPDGHTVYAAMEGTLAGDIAPSGRDTFRRVLVYRGSRHGWRLSKQIGYRVQRGNRISEAQAYGRDGLLVMEAAWSEDAGNSVELYAVHPARARSIAGVRNLGARPGPVAHKRLVTNVTRCPSLGATAKETQKNPLMDNFEAMTIVPRHRRTSEVVLVSDDNFSDTQTTRVLRLSARLP